MLCLLVLTGAIASCSGFGSSGGDTLGSSSAAVTSIKIGETTILSGTDSGNGNLLVVQDVTLSQSATIQSMSFYVRHAAGSLRLGIYDNTGPGSGPGALKAQTASITTVAGWDTANVVTPVSLPAGNYWLAYLPSSSSLTFAAKATGTFKYASFSFGSMPSTFPTVAGSGSTHWSIYATLNVNVNGTGGAPGTGGSPSTGGSRATGGNPATGGAATGGTPPTGGSPATGGNPATGGAATGGTPPTGGNPSTGGDVATGGNVSTGGSVSTGGQSTGGSLSTGPSLIQHVASSSNPIGVGLPGNNFKIPLPNAVGAGNCLVLGTTYPSGNVPVVVDNNGNTWPTTATVTADAGQYGYISTVWVLPNANAGKTLITVSFLGDTIPFQYVVSEFNNVATVNPVNGTSIHVDGAGPSLTTGTLTPGNNDANGGNVIWNYYALSSSANGNPTNWSPGNNFALLDADIAWTTNQGFPHASQWFLQTTTSQLSPGITATGDGANHYNSVAVALKAAQAGTAAPAGIHINKILHQTSNGPPSGTWSLQFPATGNLRVIATANGNNLTDITSITDSDNSTWTKLEPSDDEPQIWYSPNTSVNTNLVVTLHLGQGPTMTLLFYDISGAATSPLDTFSGEPSTGVSGQSSVSGMPVITPLTANGLVLAVMGIGDGPVLGLGTGSPTGAGFDLVTYSDETDLDLMENADAHAHLYNTDTSAESWNWNLTPNSNNSVFATAAAFRAQ